MTVARFHSNAAPALRNAGDCIERHQWRVQDLCRRILAHRAEEPSAELIRAALYHDEPERALGDIPGPAKERFPEIAAAFAKAEATVMAEMGIAPFQLSPDERATLHLADKADAWRTAVEAGQGETEEWRAFRRNLFRLSWEAGHGAWWEAWAKEVER